MIITYDPYSLIDDDSEEERFLAHLSLKYNLSSPPNDQRKNYARENTTHAQHKQLSRLHIANIHSQPAALPVSNCSFMYPLLIDSLLHVYLFFRSDSDRAVEDILKKY